MATLREVTDVFRHILAIAFLLIVGIFIIITAVNIYKSLHPTPPPPPSVSFGKLPVLVFPKNVSDGNFQFNLDTLSGNLPDLGDRAMVYKTKPVQPSLTALDAATKLLMTIGYNGSPRQISESIYSWTNTDPLPKTFLLNIYSNNFAITSSYLSNQDVIQGNNLSDQNSAITTVMTFLQGGGLLPSDIDNSKTKTTLLSISNGQLIPATSLSHTQLIEVDLFQNDVNELPIFYSTPTHSTMNLFVGGGSIASQIVLANFTHQTITNETATYPIISSQEAFSMLKKGQAFIASFDGTGMNISIHNVVLGYYMSDKPQQYLEPIVVFEGDNGFFAYVPAIKTDWLQQ